MVIVETWEGKTDEQKEMLIRNITKAFEDIGIKPEAVEIIIHEVQRKNWGKAGKHS